MTIACNLKGAGEPVCGDAATLEARLRAAGNRPAGFDYLRIILPISVVAWHTVLTTYGPAVEAQIWVSPWRPLPYLIVPCFFALSGFLVAGSLERNTLPAFLTLRVLRIFSALVVEVVFTALLLGPLLTTVPLLHYFASREFDLYLLNVFGEQIQYNLPGLFTSNPEPRFANLQLWTVPYELDCYLLISLVSLVRLYRRPALLLALCMGASLSLSIWRLSGHPLDHTVRPSGAMVVICFLMGVALYGLRRRLHAHVGLFGLSLALGLLFVANAQTGYLAALPLTYVTVYLGLLNPPRNAVLRGADYSYGVYLYGFPVQQTVSLLFPGLRVWWFSLPLALAGAAVLAMLSWTLVESPVLARRTQALDLVNRLSRAARRTWPFRRSLGQPARSAEETP